MAHEDRTSYILRGQLVREALLCTEVPPPPAGVDASETNIPATATAQERSKLHRVKPECASCHELFDPLGFAFEIYDPIGRFRTADAAGKADRFDRGHQRHQQAGRHRAATPWS